MAASADKKSDKQTDKQVMDVSKPGKSPANASARPVIIGHGPQVQDPMVNTPEDSNPEVEEKTPAVQSTTKKVITPISESDKPAEETEAAAPEAAEAPSDEQAAETAEPAGDESSDAAVVDAVADQVGAKKKEEQASEEDKKKQEALNKLVAEKKYFVPIGQARHRRRVHGTYVALLVAVVAGAAFLAAADAGLVNAGFDLPFDLL